MIDIDNLVSFRHGGWVLTPVANCLGISWVLCKHGEWATPVAIIDDCQMQLLAKDVLCFNKGAAGEVEYAVEPGHDGNPFFLKQIKKVIACPDCHGSSSCERSCKRCGSTGLIYGEGKPKVREIKDGEATK